MILLDGENAIVEEQQHKSDVVAQRRSIEGDVAVDIVRILCVMQQATEKILRKEVVVQPNGLHFISLAWIARGEDNELSMRMQRISNLLEF